MELLPSLRDPPQGRLAAATTLARRLCARDLTAQVLLTGSEPVSIALGKDLGTRAGKDSQAWQLQEGVTFAQVLCAAQVIPMALERAVNAA
ncbi:hypothetical protein GCM10017557_14510 [Streptomyces aurantiacus]|uniref:Uncharacterized protein n=1 Tax=Streptomyces aurantiacus TaxID=47760 RepID=A0A7G1NVG1_9ACTN|nr:hypothetical protein GCM10017557_14510 [Streptomyces aurantiacus]